MSRPPKLVVRVHTPTRRAWLAAALLLVMLVAAYVSFEYGRFRAGFDVLATRRERNQLRDELDQLNTTSGGLRGQAAELETLKASQARERAEVSRTIGELQAQVARQSQDLSFYKGLVVQDRNTPEVKIQQLHIVRGAKELSYVVRLTLARPSTSDNQVSGTLILSVSGHNGGKTDTLRLPEQSFTLRYFENLQPEIVLPAGFRPERLQVEVKSGRRGIEPLVQSFIWTVEAS